MTAVPLSPTLAINEEVQRRQDRGLPTVPLGFGEVGLPVLPELVEQLSAAASRASYPPVVGIRELREAAAGYWDRRGLPTDPDLVVAGPGSKALLYALLHAIDGPVALPGPSWVSYGAQVAILREQAHLIPIRPSQGGVPDPDRLDAAVGEAARSGRPIRAVVVTLPDNPTGTLASPDIVEQLCVVAERHDLLVVCDEIYRDLIHDPNDAAAFRSPAEHIPDRVVITTGLSKNLGLGGWRIGVTRLPPSAIGRRLKPLVDGVASEIWSSAAYPVQVAAAWAFAEPHAVRERIERSRCLHAAIADAGSRVLTAAGVEHPAPQGAFYLYPDLTTQRDHLAEAWSIKSGRDLASTLLRTLGVATLPASAFGEADEVLRLRLATSLLYGSDDEQRLIALNHPDPQTLPWITAYLDQLAAALRTLSGAG